jgi:hypothetical protein
LIGSEGLRAPLSPPPTRKERPHEEGSHLTFHLAAAPGRSRTADLSLALLSPNSSVQPPSSHDGLPSPRHMKTLYVLARWTFRGPRLRDRPSARRASSMPGQPCSGGTARRTGVPRRGQVVLYLSGPRCAPATEPGWPRGPGGSGRPRRLRDREFGTADGFHAHFLRRRQGYDVPTSPTKNAKPGSWGLRESLLLP